MLLLLLRRRLLYLLHLRLLLRRELLLHRRRQLLLLLLLLRRRWRDLLWYLLRRWLLLYLLLLLLLLLLLRRLLLHALGGRRRVGCRKAYGSHLRRHGLLAGLDTLWLGYLRCGQGSAVAALTPAFRRILDLGVRMALDRVAWLADRGVHRLISKNNDDGLPCMRV